MDDATRINLLGGMLRQAAIAKAARPAQLDAMEGQGMGGGGAPPAAGLQTPQMQPAQGMPGAGMSQQQFGGQQWTPEQRMAQQRALAQILRARGGAASAPGGY